MIDPKIHQLLSVALGQQGAPYLWTGKGDFYVDTNGTVRKWPPQGDTVNGAVAPRVFDCSGLVNWSSWCVGTADRRANFNAQKLANLCAPLTKPQTGIDPPIGALLFYGSSPEHVTHVALSLGNGLKVEAAGGDSTTRTVLDAQMQNAKVAVRFENRNDCVGWADGLVLFKP